MGYSCTVKADMVLEALYTQLQATGPAKVANGWTVGKREYFFEQGRENTDGSITGTIREVICKLAYHRGSAKINHDGKISRWPSSTKAQRESAMIAGLVKFHSEHGGGWLDDAVLARLVFDCNFVVID